MGIWGRKRVSVLNKNKFIMVYCPKCGEIANANELACPHCKESLRNALEVDPDEAKRKRKRQESFDRMQKRRLRSEKREAIFNKVPVLRPLYYAAITVFIISIPFIIRYIYSLNKLVGSSIVTVLFILFYIWYVPIIIDNKDGFIERNNYPEDMPFRYKHANDMNSFFWGLIILGAIVILCLLAWVYDCSPFGAD